MNGSAKVSVVITTYNRADKILSALKSVLEQTYEDYDLWIVDDGSKDNTQEVVRPFLSERVHYVHQRNAGMSRARNTGIQRSNGEYVALLDDDDTCLPERLEVQAQFLDTHPEIGLVFSDLWKVYPDGRRSRFTENVPRFWKMFQTNSRNGKYVIPAKEMLESILLELPFKPSTVMMRRRCFDTAGLFDDLVPGEMLDLALRLIRAGETFGYLHQPVINYQVWHGNHSAGVRAKGPKNTIHVLTENRRLARLNALEDRWARCGIAVQYYKLGNILLQDGHRASSCSAFLNAFRQDRNPLYLGLALSCGLPGSAGNAAKWVRRKIFGSLLRKPWETEVTKRV